MDGWVGGWTDAQLAEDKANLLKYVFITYDSPNGLSV